ncbi:S-layer homology domain-containing protein [Pseudoflavonifractor sp. MCC625]|uniref:S-layer homology domain-containing protein n=1 Tax=Pseudoflavonifractor sp. MCC625 TaxID=2592647 RepID=UPI001C01B6CC|nr:S-layer homology domain-containing protein [Pseudoflavonifractor sp. MCC625]MBT9685291.1 hypothetical protein [Pseudoflavonifractor sp. MCC625]
MSRIKKTVTMLVAVMLMVSISVSATAADWPQFLGDPATQGVSNGDGAVSGTDLTLRWDKNTGSTWQDVPGTPIVVDGCVYYYSSQYLRKVDLATGKELATAPVYGLPVNQFFINIAYGEGKIFVPCQTDNLDDGVEIKGCFLRVYDAKTLEQLYVTESLGSGQPQSPVMYHDGYFVTGIYGRNGIYAGFTAEDEDPSRCDEVKPVRWTVDPDSKYGFSFNGAAFVGDYCYFGCDNILYVVDYKTGEASSFDIGTGYAIRSSISYSSETKRLYVASNHSEYHAAVFSYELKVDGMPNTSTVCKWISDVPNGGTQSTPVVYKGRLYLGGGGHTMGSNEPFHVLDAITLKEIYSVPILSKGSAGISTAYATEENGWKVYIYMVPFAPNAKGTSEMWIISDSQGQTKASYEIVDNIGQSQYCSQSVIVASDGSLIWYNDAGRVYCYENSKGIFDDTKNHWAKESVAYLARRGVVNGIGNNLFNPQGTITRGQFAQILANMSGDDFSGCTTNAFSDVSTQWFAHAVAWAVENSVVDTDESTYRPDEPITREDMALMLYRYATKVAGSQLPAIKDTITFTDAQSIDAKTIEAVTAMQRGGIINGIADGNGFCFAPQKQATRAEASAMIARFYEALNR